MPERAAGAGAHPSPQPKAGCWLTGFLRNIEPALKNLQ